MITMSKKVSMINTTSMRGLCKVNIYDKFSKLFKTYLGENAVYNFY